MKKKVATKKAAKKAKRKLPKGKSALHVAVTTKGYKKLAAVAKASHLSKGHIVDTLLRNLK